MLRKWDPKSIPRPVDGSPPLHPRPSARPADIQSIGAAPWSESLIRDTMKEFLGVYGRLPVQEAGTGILSPDAFALWFMVRALAPKALLESGVDNGISTWILEQSAANAGLTCLCPDPARRGYVSPVARYSDADFLEFDLGGVDTDPGTWVVLFDDHLDVFPRIRRCAEAGIKHLIFHANYPEYTGRRHISLAACLNARKADGKPAFPEEKKYLLDRAERYFIFPPPFDHPEAVTLEKSFITTKSLCGPFHGGRDESLRRLHDEMSSYRWTSYLKLK